jgi:hypothetical protein
VRLLNAIAALLPAIAMAGGDSYSDMFSASFKSSIDAAMAQPDKDQRVQQLSEAMRQGTDREVFFVMPLLFPESVLLSAKQAGVCTDEIEASMGNVGAYMSSSEAQQAAFPEAHATRIRSDTDRLMRCLHQFYETGNLRFPSEQSNNSFKPKR